MFFTPRLRFLTRSLTCGLLVTASLSAAEQTPDPAVQVQDVGPNGVLVTGGAAAAVDQQARNRLPPSTLSPDERAEAVLKQMTPKERWEYVGGQQNRTRAIARLGIPEFLMSDGPLGLRRGGKHSTCYPAGPCVAATWNRDLVKAMGVAYGRDYRANGFCIALGPGVNIIRDPRGGRNFEYLSEDPYLSGTLCSSQVQGIQSQGVLATIKHYAANNLETKRNFYSAEVDDRTMHEIYLPGFRIPIIEGGAGCVMNGFNLVNGVYCSSSAYLNTEILRGEWKFTGIVMSDWTGARGPVDSMNGGLDLEMPFGKEMSPENIEKAIASGTVTQETIDTKVRRILRTCFAAGFFDREQTLPGLSTAAAGLAEIPGSMEASLAVAREGITLLKNDHQTLPWKPSEVKSLVVFGRPAEGSLGGGGSSIMSPFRSVTILKGLQAVYQKVDLVKTMPSIDEVERVPVVYEGPVRQEFFKNRNFKNAPAITRTTDAVVIKGGVNAPDEKFPKEFAARFTATIRIPKEGIYDFVVANENSDAANLQVDGKTLITSGNKNGLARLTAGTHTLVAEYLTYGRKPPNFRLGWAAAERVNSAVAAAKQADAVVFCAGFNYHTEGEGQDRTWDLGSYQQTLLEVLAPANPRTAVILFGGGATDTTGWLDHTPAFIHAYYPGQEGGTAMAEIISGTRSPSGKLPYTFPRRIEDHPSYPYFLDPADVDKNRARYEEGVFVGYRGYDAKNIEPLYPFGHGLSYTTFTYSDLKLTKTKDGKITVTYTIRNTGGKEGGEVAQVYVTPAPAPVPRPPKELKGYTKVQLKPGESSTVSVTLDRNDFAYWDVATKTWVVAPGTYGIQVSASSRDIRLRDDCQIP